jgi:lipopolysaccharide/colanic/teichoic acid biosynthesis glycosyltransferase/glycosyltransferase involved in cell wall biosynthesis
LNTLTECDRVEVVPLQIEREINPAKDLASLWRLYRLMRKLRPTIVNAATPKAGFLGIAAAWLARVPKRVYSLWGLRLETANGLKRLILKATETLACRGAHVVLCVGDSLRQRAIELRLTTAERSCVVAHGSWNGADISRFGPSDENLQAAAILRSNLSLKGGAPVVGFVGRLTRDKGIPELIQAYQRLRRTMPELRLLLVGDFEDGDPVPEEVHETIVRDSQIIVTGFVRNPAPYFHLMNVLAFPSHREGFPNVPLEAAAAGVPVVAAAATGTVDAVLDGITGIVVPVGDERALTEGIRTTLEDRARSDQFACNAQVRAERDFSPETVWRGLVSLYQQMIAVSRTSRNRSVALWGKRILDFIGSLAGLLLLSPVMLGAALWIRLTMGAPVLFKPSRIGHKEWPFTLYKFRTMTSACDEHGALLPDEQRLTTLGRLLRKFSLDELPQLWNVLKGEMSLVGPRPLPPKYLPRYSDAQRRRHDVKPGITGWAQIHGRNALTWEEKFDLDIWYIDNWSLWLDVKALMLTVLKVLRSDGISQSGYATMPEFMGAPKSSERAQ